MGSRAVAWLCGLARADSAHALGVSWAHSAGRWVAADRGCGVLYPGHADRLDATVMLLLLLFMLKLLEMRNPRDALVVIYLGFFILATAFLFDQGIPLTLYQCVGAVVLGRR
ncbi:transglutaminaseTgpA domain-containing protein [Halopseudomonas pachastrellae]|nr:transglutaminaseTgpA domain-containing protein [Halopseudomonas pachastrellae]